MRADRLLSLLMLLQARGRMTARELAEELEVTERTIYRDMDALSAAGVPVYGEPGPEGGYALLDSYRTSLIGLSQGELQALFMLGIPAPLADLGVGQALKGALLKLAAALPDAQRADEARVRQRFYLDANWWDQGEEQVPHLTTIHQAVWQDRLLTVSYRVYGVPVDRLVEPYGLVAKAGVWYLVCARKGRVRVHRVSELLDAHMEAESFERPPGFDLGAFWADWCAQRVELRALYHVTVRVAPHFVDALPGYLGPRIRERVAQAGPPDAEGWITLKLAFESFQAARAQLLGFGAGVEVLEPYALRRSLLDIAEQVVGLYTRE
ncbi:MAG: WYL domain-containing protein [Chloroflexi bacterium]|nr:WYL domain-containing protein [Chloroflexota bacterium]